MFRRNLDDEVELRPLEPWHAKQFFAAVESDRDHLLPYIPFSHTVRSVDDARAFLQRFADWHAADTRHIAGLWSGDAVIGVLLFPVFDPRHRTCEIGVWISTGHEGRGLITKAVTIALDWAFNERGVRRVVWKNNPENTRSSRVAKRLGMTFEGIERQGFIVVEGGPSYDSEVWSLLASEWRP